MSDMTTKNGPQTWSPRFDKPLNEKMKMFNQSILFDYRLAKWDIIASMAHAKMLEKVGLFTADELALALGGDGYLAAMGGESGAGIGGRYRATSGAIEIRGGEVVATGTEITVKGGIGYIGQGGQF